MPRSDGHHAAAMYFILGVRGALARIRHDSRVFATIADAMERGGAHLTSDDKAALQTAARWMRTLGTVEQGCIATPARPRD